jgi:hypothetical protein
VALDHFDRVVEGPRGRVAFRGSTSALLRHAGSGSTVIARTGDRLPAPLQGTFNAFDESAINEAGVAW